MIKVVLRFCHSSYDHLLLILFSCVLDVLCSCQNIEPLFSRHNLKIVGNIIDIDLMITDSTCILLEEICVTMFLTTVWTIDFYLTFESFTK